MEDWAFSRFTGPFTALDAIPLRPHDPDLPMWGASFRSWNPNADEVRVSGAGWTDEEAKLACLGETIERIQPGPLDQDQFIESSFAAWPMAEPAIDPDNWVLFHPDQYLIPGFPFAPFSKGTVCRWYACRNIQTGLPAWVPEEMIFLHPRRGAKHQICASITTGLAAGPRQYPVVLRGLQEVIERDAAVGGWWGRYAVEEWPAREVFDQLGDSIARRLQRANLRFSFYRIRTPWSQHVTWVRLEGEDREGYCFSIGSACRETRQASWQKSILEAVQGRHYVRYLKILPEERRLPMTFAEHAVYYSRHPKLLERTVLNHAVRPDESESTAHETLEILVDRLGRDHPVLFRILTPPEIAVEFPDWRVVRVIVAGLQPLHGNHFLAHRGGPLWSPRNEDDWNSTLPHPFP